MRSPESRRRAERAGRRAETLCALLLRLKGYRILGRRVRTPAGEIDIVAASGVTVAFVEVKARADTTSAAWALRPAQQQRLARAAAAFAAIRPDWAWRDIRFDVMLVRPWRLPIHLRDAWRPEGGG